MSFFREREILQEKERDYKKELAIFHYLAIKKKRKIKRQNKNPWRKPFPEVMEEVTRFVKPNMYLTDNVMHRGGQEAISGKKEST